MSAFPFLIDLCESHLIPSKGSLKHWKPVKLAELCYLYFIGLRILLANRPSQEWARKYCGHAGEPNDFSSWRTNGNDLYAMLYALTSDEDAKVDISTGLVRHWLRHIATHEDEPDTHRLFMRLDGMFHITDSSMRSVRRVVTDWNDADRRERDDVLTKLIQMIYTRAPTNSELLPHLKLLQKKMDESASAGATGAANVATVVGGLGAGFDPDGDWRSVYGSKKKKKPIMLRRIVEGLQPKIDKYLAQAVLDSCLQHGFDMSDWAAPSMWDDENGDEEADEDVRLIDNIVASMRQEWKDQIKPAIQGHQMRVYRAVAVASIYQLKSDALGKHWSTSRQHAYPYWASKGHSGRGAFWLVIQALVDLKHVEWADTFALHLEGGEDEVELYAGTPVMVTGVEWYSDRGPIEDSSGQELIGQILTT